MYRFVQSLSWQGSEWNVNLSWSKGIAFSFLTRFLHMARKRGKKNHSYVLYTRGYIEYQAKFMKPIVQKARIILEQNGAARVAEG
mmetsp:Transcript_778/g.4831  ORF Transcript_778/g.4831 Transcript_778/m.4831 type:complete len:85 (-) Transcript_778:816-1070(-)